MANISLVSVVFYGEEQKIKRLERDLKRSCRKINRKKTKYKSDYDWIGNIFVDHREILGCNKNIESISIPDFLQYISRDGNRLYLELNARWSSNFNIYRILAEHYDVKFEASQEECSDDIYVNTDLTGDYLPDKYRIKYMGEDEDRDIDSNYCSNKTEVDEFLNKQDNKDDWEVYEYESEYTIEETSRIVIGRRSKRRRARLRKKREMRKRR